jgi:hypothetical protein
MSTRTSNESTLDASRLDGTSRRGASMGRTSSMQNKKAGHGVAGHNFMVRRIPAL